MAHVGVEHAVDELFRFVQLDVDELGAAERSVKEEVLRQEEERKLLEVETARVKEAVQAFQDERAAFQDVVRREWFDVADAEKGKTVSCVAQHRIALAHILSCCERRSPRRFSNPFYVISLLLYYLRVIILNTDATKRIAQLSQTATVSLGNK